MKYVDIIRNPHFQQLASIVGLAFHAHYHRIDHLGQTKFRFHEHNFSERVFSGSNLEDTLNSFTAMLNELTAFDDRLFVYSKADLDWFVEQLDSPEARVVLAMFCGYYSARATYYTPAKAAEITGMSESHFRNAAAFGEIPAIKKGKQWLIPQAAIRHLIKPELMDNDEDTSEGD